MWTFIQQHDSFDLPRISILRDGIEYKLP